MASLAITDHTSQSQCHITTDDQSVSASWFRARSGAHDQMLITVSQLLFCRYRAPPLTGGRVSNSNSKSHYDRRPVGQCVLVSISVWGSWSDVNYSLTVTVSSISGAPSDERTGLSFVLVTWTASVQFSKFAVRIYNPRREGCPANKQASKQAVAYCWHSPAWLFLV
jgi:hypothetical protein